MLLLLTVVFNYGSVKIYGKHNHQCVESVNLNVIKLLKDLVVVIPYRDELDRMKLQQYNITRLLAR